LHRQARVYGNILPRYTSATGGGSPYNELSRSAIEDVYAQAMSEARTNTPWDNTPVRPKAPTTARLPQYRSAGEPAGLKISAKDGYYPHRRHG